MRKSKREQQSEAVKAAEFQKIIHVPFRRDPMSLMIVIIGAGAFGVLIYAIITGITTGF